MDKISVDARSRNMAAIRSANTKPELIVRRFLHKKGMRYRLHDRKLPGRPDIVFRKNKIALFVHGCYWHRHAGCKYATTPKSNVEFWEKKFSDNKRRDREVRESLIRAGWAVFTIWECEIDLQSLEVLATKIRRVRAEKGS